MLLDQEFLTPPREFSVLPFWFWNDDLSRIEIARQIADFEAHNVYGFVIHPRVGLPREIAWMSDTMLDFVEFAVLEAERRNMLVVLYDEGMYPSGSSNGQIVARNPELACRGLERIQLTESQELDLPAGHRLLCKADCINGSRLAVIDRPVGSFIRGLHYLGEGPEEEEPPAANILDPRTTTAFIELVYEKYYRKLGRHFGRTIIGIFTDEPNMLGRLNLDEDLVPGNADVVARVSEKLGYDFTPHLPSLWSEDEIEAAGHKAAYHQKLGEVLQEVYYQPLSSWCEAHGVALMGHPAQPDEIGCERYFHVPGQDIVWRHIEPGQPSALEGASSTQAKCTSSAALHLRRRRNSNECFGAFGHDFTYDEMLWLTNWLFVRGVNMLVPHAFYYSMRGPRRDERPPDVGPNSSWWAGYARFATYCARLSWLNTDSRPVCRIAVLAEAEFLPWRAARVCFENQMDFNYLEMRDLWENATVDESGIRIADQSYEVLIVDGLETCLQALPSLQNLAEAGRLIEWPLPDPLWGLAQEVDNPEDLVEALRARITPDLRISPSHRDLRYRHVVKNGQHYYLLFNEGSSLLEFSLETRQAGSAFMIDAWEGTIQNCPSRIVLPGHGTVIVGVEAS